MSRAALPAAPKGAALLRPDRDLAGFERRRPGRLGRGPCSGQRLAADEVVHRPRILSPEGPRPLRLRGRLRRSLDAGPGDIPAAAVECGVPLRVYGPRWKKSSQYAFPEAAPAAAVAPLGDEPYVKAIAGAKIAIGLLAKENLDLHTTRSLEIPAIGTLFCAQRTAGPSRALPGWRGGGVLGHAGGMRPALPRPPARPARPGSDRLCGRQRALRNRNFNEALLTPDHRCAPYARLWRDGAMRPTSLQGMVARPLVPRPLDPGPASRERPEASLRCLFAHHCFDDERLPLERLIKRLLAEGFHLSRPSVSSPLPTAAPSPSDTSCTSPSTMASPTS